MSDPTPDHNGSPVFLNDVEYRYEVRKHSSKDRWAAFAFTQWRRMPMRNHGPGKWRKTPERAVLDGEKWLTRIVNKGGER